MLDGRRASRCRAMTVRIFITGGTFDKSYDEITGTLDFSDTHVPEMLRLGRCRLPVRCGR